MKTPKSLLLCAFLASILLLSNCSKDDEFEFGTPITDFITDSVYKSSSAGFLFVETISFGGPYDIGAATAKIYADQTSDPSTEVGIVRYSVTIPLKKDIFWKVTNLTTGGSFRIMWTPIQ